MMQEELNALETSFRQQGLTWNQTNFAVAVIRNYVEPLRQQLEASQKREVMLRDALRALTQCSPAEVECNNMHHKKQDLHDYDETCPVVVRYATALYDAQEALAATEQNP